MEAYCRRLLHEVDSLEDVLQSAVANAFRDFDQYAEGTNFRAWIFKHTHSEAMNWNRKHQRTQAAALREDEVAAKETWDAILDEPLLKVLLEAPGAVLDHCDASIALAVKSLSLEDQAVSLLHVVGDFKYREIADILHVPIGTVMSRLARCRVRLRQRLVEYGERHGLHRHGEI